MEYKIQIDGLRFFAIISVMIGHWIAWDTDNLILKHTPWGNGVILFFVISGFLITKILLDQKSRIIKKEITYGAALKTFYLRRIIRIFPIYYLLVLYLYYINYPEARALFYWLITYSVNIYQGIQNQYVGNFSHFWSLAVEEQFYFIWPFLIFMIPEKNLKKLFVIIMLISVLSRSLCVFLYPEKWMLASYFTPNLFMPLSAGALLAYWEWRKSQIYYVIFKPMNAFIVLLIYSVVHYFFIIKLRSNLYKSLLDEYFFAIVCAFFVAVASIGGFRYLTRYILENKCVNYLGRISYGVYIYHLFVISFFWEVFTVEAQLTTNSKVTARVFYFLICFSMAILSYNMIEKPFNKIKNWFSY